MAEYDGVTVLVAVDELGEVKSAYPQREAEE